MLYFDEAVATLDYGNGCTDEFGDYGRGVITVRTTNVEMDLEAVLIPTALPKSTKAQGFESPLTPTLSPLVKGGEGREWGDSARAGIGELWLGGWYNKLWTRDW
jgi:hypothetical protein